MIVETPGGAKIPVNVTPFPVGFEAETVLGKVKSGERILYLDSCACSPLYKRLASRVGEENIRTTRGTHESIDMEGGWATIVIGQCVLDELLDFSKAFSEAARVLAEGGSVLLSGPVSRSGVLKFKTRRGEVNLLTVDDISRRLLHEGLSVVDVADLTVPAKNETACCLNAAGQPVLDLERSMRWVLIEARKGAEHQVPVLKVTDQKLGRKEYGQGDGTSSSTRQTADLASSACGCADCSLDLARPPRSGSPRQSQRSGDGGSQERKPSRFAGKIRLMFLALVAGISLLEIIGEHFDIQQFGTLGSIPPPILIAAILVGGYPIFRAALAGLWHRTANVDLMMSVGIVAAAAIGQYTSSVLIVFFMAVAHFTESFTVKGSTKAVRDLLKLSPKKATVIREGHEIELPLDKVVPGDVVVVHPGEHVPVDGNVIAGHGVVDQSAITGESIPTEKQPGDPVYAATMNQNGMMKVKAERVGNDTSFGRIVKLVIEAQGGAKSRAQRLADRYTRYFLPGALTASLLTFLASHNIVFAIAVLVAACPCAVGLATPLSVVASTGAAAKKGLLIKGGLYLESLAKVDTVVVDKTGTLTLGHPAVTAVRPLGTLSEWEVLRIAASIERYSEHPLASAIVEEATRRGIPLQEPDAFEIAVGRGVICVLKGENYSLGNQRLAEEKGLAVPRDVSLQSEALQQAGNAVLYLFDETDLLAMIAVADKVRDEVSRSIEELGHLGITRIILLTGDNEKVASAVAAKLKIPAYKANLMPEDKVSEVRRLQSEGHRVLLVGDGINDAPALAQADVGMAMGGIGTDIAIEASDVALMRDDWRMVPLAIRVARRTYSTIRQNLVFGVAFNIAAMGLAGIGILTPVMASAAQAAPDVLVSMNSAKLLRTG